MPRTMSEQSLLMESNDGIEELLKIIEIVGKCHTKRGEKECANLLCTKQYLYTKLPLNYLEKR